MTSASGIDVEMKNGIQEALEALEFICLVCVESDTYTRGPSVMKPKHEAKVPGQPQHVWAYRKAMRQLHNISKTADSLAQSLDKTRDDHDGSTLTSPRGVAGRPAKATYFQVQVIRDLRADGMTPAQLAACGVIPRSTFWQMLARGKNEVVGIDRALWEAVYGG